MCNQTTSRNVDIEVYLRIEAQLRPVPEEDRQLFTEMYYQCWGLMGLKLRSETGERSNPHILRSEP